MFVMTAKLSKPKLIAAGVLLAAAVLLIVLLSLNGGSGEKAEPAGASNDDRVAYLASWGWDVNVRPKEALKVRIPDGADNQVFSRYNELQKSQGFDLSAYSGKDIMRYVYEVLNYKDTREPVYATVLVADGRIVGGDITNTAPDGVIHGFEKPGSVHQKAEATEPPSDKETQPAKAEPPTEPA